MKATLKLKISVAVFCGVIILTAITLLKDYYYSKNIIANQAMSVFLHVEKTFQSALQAKFSDLSKAVQLIALNQNYAELVANSQREELVKKLLPYYLRIKKDIKQFQFHLPPAISFLRLHKIKKFGDDLSSFRKTVVECNTKKKAVMGLEVGRGGPGLRVVYPIFYHNKHIGSVEFGGGISSVASLIDKNFGMQYAIGIYDVVFKKIEEPHKTIHVKGKEIIDAIKNNQQDVAKERMYELIEVLNSFINDIDKLIEKYI
jgi:methyl-accepting chemotaxis protein